MIIGKKFMGKRQKIQPAELGDYDHDRFIVMTRMAKRSQAANAQSLLTMAIRRNWPNYEKALEYEAEILGITSDELFKLYLDGNINLEDKL